MSGFRLRGHDAAPVPFSWQGREMLGAQGDTLAAALMANGVRTLGRSFKHHRPRGIMSAGEEEAGALVTVGEGARRTPNLKPSVVELEAGLSARAQNCWPSPRLDLGAVNDLLSPLFAAGFYYKTFMGPFADTRIWMACERAIRRAAGMGAASALPDPDLYDQVHGHCDVLVVGSGPAGMAAAREAAEAGLDVALAEADFAPGGDRLSDGEPEALAADLAEIAALPNLRLMTRTMVFGLYDHGVAGLVERLPAASAYRERLHVLRTRKVIAATGAIQRGFVFGDNDRPGVMSAAAARTYVRRFGVAPAREVVVAGAEDSAFAASIALAEAGLDVIHLDAREALAGALVEQARAAGVDLRAGWVPVRTQGHPLTGELTGLSIGRHLGGGRTRAETRISAGALAVSGGWSPAIHLTTQARQTPAWDEALGCFLPGPGEVLSCGAAAGVWTREGAEASGRAAGRLAAIALRATRRRPLKDVEPGGHAAPPEPLWEVRPAGRAFHGLGKGYVDPLHDVTAADVRLAHQEGFAAPEHMKRYTTLGMAPDQGKAGGVIGLAVLAAARGEDASALSPTTFRPPYAPVSMGVFAGLDRGAGWAPVRRTPFHAAAAAEGAVFVDAGLWKRAWFFPEPGEDLTAASMREAAMVRASVGVVDVSTLGKFEVQGPGAAAFLDRVFSNRIGTLPVGRARYGFLLREDGIVLDDGTVWRLGEERFLVTCTTAHAATVEEHLSRWRFRWPELEVSVDDATEAWCGLAVAGPRSRAVLAAIAEGDVSDAALPHLGVREMTVAGAPVRVARLSFSGERAFEILVRPEAAPALWDAALAAAKAEGGGLYGLEALDILRVEKGHVTGREIDGRVTLGDLGMPGMASRAKDFVGRALIEREGLVDPGRPALIGLRPVERGAKLRAGSLLHPLGAETGRGIGHVSSIADSPALGMRIALGFAAGGRARWEGKLLMAKDPISGQDVKMVACAPCFVDPEGERLHG
ncbi:2Fe-2S iron-sulfur cluster-binding protein [Albimonas sp. CAU 1670]|uniref:2Fe-2S iron-sulfur cluster-binding protein n=1 Tax=Albimonas sp. CAU 1670 TaxID=3032599 RepID=UPI0023DAAB36|nr:2Fe-2S iron-sulfur cluster-binding protein [Albimonas sp. CAU 1670]MDF2233479.1 2Fe-2S iron-sulfur cluster-binding protein [Albimonas sp. CAU 1670]